MKNRFYLPSSHGNLGSNMVFHRHDGCGYSTDIDQAHVYTLEEAQKEWNYGDEAPISADHVDALAVWKVDHQYISTETICTDEHELYVAYQKKRWDGNDVYWMTMFVQPLTDFDRAYKMNYELAQAFLNSADSSDFIVIPQELADKVKRRTFDFSKLNKRTMIQGAGLITPDCIKKEKHRKINPMTRFNCPTCGKINWQHNPYDFDGCNHCCHGWSGAA